MAEEKKATAKVIVPVKAEAEVAKKEEKVAPVKKAAPAKKTAAKKDATSAKAAAAKATAVKAEEKAPKKAAAKKETAKKETVKKAAAKGAEKCSVNFEFSGKSYTPEDLINIAKDVWKYDLNGKASDFKSVELYVKPEESTTYYVINGDVTGSFFI